MLALPTGEVIACATEEDPPLAQAGGAQYAVSMRAAPPFHQWERQGRVRVPVAGGECQIARGGLDGNELVMFLRSTGSNASVARGGGLGSSESHTGSGHAVAFSATGGQTWQHFTQLSARAMFSADCQGSIVSVPARAPDNWTLIAAAPRLGAPVTCKACLRTNLTLFKSRDGLKWSEWKLMWPTISAYSSMVVHDGMLLVFFETGTQEDQYQEVRLAKVDMPRA